MDRTADYEAIAARFDRRYAEVDYSGVEAAVRTFVGPGGSDVLEVGCGTGHWLRVISDSPGLRLGVDPSIQMLRRACADAAGITVVRARAETLPCKDRSFDRVMCVNAFHHFVGKPDFLAEAHRVLRPGGRLLILGLDPHVAGLRWWVYDNFPATRAIDRARYPPVARIRSAMHRAGFVQCSTRRAQRMTDRLMLEEAERRGFLDKAFTSQLSLLSDAEYQEGLRRLRARRDDAARQGRRLLLKADIALYATVGEIEPRETRSR